MSIHAGLWQDSKTGTYLLYHSCRNPVKVTSLFGRMGCAVDSACRQIEGREADGRKVVDKELHRRK